MTAQSPSARSALKLPACVFCDSPDVTKEHLLADWIFRCIQKTRRPKINVFRSSPNTGQTAYRYGEQQEAAGVACGGCNHGWMSRLDRRAADLIKPVVRGEREVVLSRGEQRDLAAWAVKTVIVNDQVITQGESRLTDYAPELRANGEPPAFLEVWLGAPSMVMQGGMRALGVRPSDGLLKLGSGSDARELPLKAWRLMLGYVDLLLRPTLLWVLMPDPPDHVRIWPPSQDFVTVLPETTPNFPQHAS